MAYSDARLRLIDVTAGEIAVLILVAIVVLGPADLVRRFWS
jgi:hypothetical protein